MFCSHTPMHIHTPVEGFTVKWWCNSFKFLVYLPIINDVINWTQYLCEWVWQCCIYGCFSYTFDKVHKLAERMSGGFFPALQSRRAASTIRLLCKLLHLCGRGPLQLFCPNFVNPATHSYRLRSYFPLPYNLTLLIYSGEVLLVWSLTLRCYSCKTFAKK